MNNAQAAEEMVHMRPMQMVENTMKLTAAKVESDWAAAKEILFKVIDHLDKNGKSLWQKAQVEVSELKKNYTLHELYFLQSEHQVCGMVIVQREDLVFWPEIKDQESYFIHKLAVLPEFGGRGCGYKIIELVSNLAKSNGLRYLRLDCDPRPELIAYYEKLGFIFVSEATLGVYPVVKYELLIGR